MKWSSATICGVMATVLIVTMWVIAVDTLGEEKAMGVVVICVVILACGAGITATGSKR